MLPFIALGGAVGTAAREGIALALPATGGFPVATLTVNLVGAFLLGLLVEALARRGGDTGRLRTLRLTLGTGVLGGFTTYSAFATDTALLLGDAPAVAVGYAVMTVVVGAAATLAGVTVGASRRRGAVPPPEPDR
ncbi:MAG: hypothetical protein RI885_2395 [Actinomycetota bacterium]|jgi:CrcB protein